METRKIENNQSKAEWSEVTISVPADRAEVIATYGDDAVNQLVKYALSASNLNVTMRGRIKDADKAQETFDSWIKTAGETSGSSETASFDSAVLEAVESGSLTVVDVVKIKGQKTLKKQKALFAKLIG